MRLRTIIGRLEPGLKTLKVAHTKKYVYNSPSMRTYGALDHDRPPRTLQVATAFITAHWDGREGKKNFKIYSLSVSENSLT